MTIALLLLHAARLSLFKKVFVEGGIRVVTLSDGGIILQDLGIVIVNRSACGAVQLVLLSP